MVDLQEEQKKITQMGGTMRLGLQPTQLKPGSQAAWLYGAFLIQERHRHRYEVNVAYKRQFEEAGLVFSGTTPDDRFMEILELPGHPFYLACQFHPEFLSKPHQPHPLFSGFIAAAHARLYKKSK